MKLLNARRVDYLLIGGYAVSLYGYHRVTADMDIWVAMSKENAGKIVRALREFGFGVKELKPSLFLAKESIVRFGVPPLRIEILTDISGVEFAEAYSRRKRATIDGIKVNLISLSDLRKNKLASGRSKDLDDLENLPSEDL